MDIMKTTIEENRIFENRIGVLNINELSIIINFKKRTIYNWIHREKGFPYKKWGKSVRFRLDDVINWLEKRS